MKNAKNDAYLTIAIEIRPPAFSTDIRKVVLDETLRPLGLQFLRHEKQGEGYCPITYFYSGKITTQENTRERDQLEQKIEECLAPLRGTYSAILKFI